MGTFSRESLELLRSRIDLVEVLSPYLKIQRSGSSYKALCPFHEEKTASFVIQNGDSHYHCFGCGAHGDAIQFLMAHLRMSFVDAVETLAEKFNIALEQTQGNDQSKGSLKSVLKDALERACRFFQFCLLHTQEGHIALEYLYDRGIDLGFIRQFQLGWAPSHESWLIDVMRVQKIPETILREVGLFNASNHVFFTNRITIPIFDGMGAVIGFTARKIQPEGYGPKYINTPETALFKKSKILFGLSCSRKKIAKERRVMIVEGQIDAMRLIYNGFDWTVAGQGTAFGEEMVKELTHLGVRKVYLALDGDTAGQEAAIKIGHAFQKDGIDVWVLQLPEKCDPDLMLRENGPEDWQKRIDGSIEYLSFMIERFSKKIHIQTPAGKNELVQTIASRIREWDHPLMVHESLRKLARLTQTPEALVETIQEPALSMYAKRQVMVGSTEINPDRILEADLLRWLLLSPVAEPIIQIAEANLRPEHFRLAVARMLYEKALKAAKENRTCDLLSLAIDLDNVEQQKFLSEILQKKVNREKAIEGFVQTIQCILERYWMQQREDIKLKIYSGRCSEEEVLELAKQFDEIKRTRPQVAYEPGPNSISKDLAGQ
jgi:DNA primase